MAGRRIITGSAPSKTRGSKPGRHHCHTRQSFLLFSFFIQTPMSWRISRYSRTPHTRPQYIRLLKITDLVNSKFFHLKSFLSSVPALKTCTTQLLTPFGAWILISADDTTKQSLFMAWIAIAADKGRQDCYLRLTQSILYHRLSTNCVELLLKGIFLLL